LIAQQPVAAASRTKILGIHPPKIPDEHAGLINGDIQSIEAEAKENGNKLMILSVSVIISMSCIL
jgi:hypothetical protein